MNSVQIRAALPGDLPGILQIYNEAVLETTATYDERPQTMEQRALWFAHHQEGHWPVLVAVSPGGPVLGWSSLFQFHDRAGYRFTAQNSVYVAARHRGCGLGTRLLGPLVEAARARGLRAILALIDAENAPSIRLHQRLGFEQVGLLRQVGFKFGRWLDVACFERVLPVPAPASPSLASVPATP